MTIASGLTSLFTCLVSHRATYARLQAEVDMHYPRAHRAMTYLAAVLNETLRLFPPVLASLQETSAFPSSDRDGTLGARLPNAHDSKSRGSVGFARNEAAFRPFSYHH
ncbi:uncharacterized protein BXZ73DRAFT_99177 [Epithele typhae]|uniref:uncharacterized protein n=1 Tax=Epithele typhae TaxID=378194 RepID=UPI0020080507|nr:uncharacterized protein BXZ73DRAFT_99177 [Epithele typhae]KAH9940182.1 hypothetical protein BXZ73DRAFT_99177 [Epithele typhae]